jgi:hypothetical protein
VQSGVEINDYPTTEAWLGPVSQVKIRGTRSGPVADFHISQLWGSEFVLLRIRTACGENSAERNIASSVIRYISSCDGLDTAYVHCLSDKLAAKLKTAKLRGTTNGDKSR